VDMGLHPDLARRDDGEWVDRFVGDEMAGIVAGCDEGSLRWLGLAGCQFRDDELVGALEPVRGSLEGLDLGYSSVKDGGLGFVATMDGLRVLDLSGLFRLRRRNQGSVVDIVSSCHSLEVLYLEDCPDLDSELKEELLQIRPDLIIHGLAEREAWSGSEEDGGGYSEISSGLEGSIGSEGAVEPEGFWPIMSTYASSNESSPNVMKSGPLERLPFAHPSEGPVKISNALLDPDSYDGPVYHSLKADHYKPDTVDYTKGGVLRPEDGAEGKGADEGDDLAASWTLELTTTDVVAPASEAAEEDVDAQHSIRFNVSQKNTKDIDCVLFYDPVNKTYILEPLQSVLTAVPVRGGHGGPLPTRRSKHHATSSDAPASPSSSSALSSGASSPHTPYEYNADDDMDDVDDEDAYTYRDELMDGINGAFEEIDGADADTEHEDADVDVVDGLADLELDEMLEEALSHDEGDNSSGAATPLGAD
ncbi:hypothetical protein HK101_005741, partial [Irineochytrium annulatum]